MLQMLSTFRALADPTRLRIMLLLQQSELSVGELAIILDQSQPRVSRHVRILDEAGLAERRKEGSWVFLRTCFGRNAPQIGAALGQLLGDPDFTEAALADQNGRDLLRLSEVRAQREGQANRYFTEHAGNWDALRSLYVPETEVETALKSGIGSESLGHLLDIGTGTGRMVELFEGQARQTTAVDNSPEMLRFARTKLQHVDPARLDLVLGDFNALPLEDGLFDTILLHQVLHYAQHPEQVLREAGRVAGPDAQIIIVDFAAHDREELRTRDAHARLGFADDQMGDLFDYGGFRLDSIRDLAGNELTVKIWTGRRRGVHQLRRTAKRTSALKKAAA